ncbi:hypothetical protein GCM10028822_08930 [Hymenobacter terrigena]
MLALAPAFAAYAVPKTWTGQVSTDYSTAGNWSPAGTPTPTDDVTIPGNGTFVAAANATVAQQPTVTAASGAQSAASLTLGNNAVLTLANGSTLNDYGNFTNNGGAMATTGGTGVLVLAGAAEQQLNGTVATTFPNLRVGAAGARAFAALNIQRSLTVSGVLSFAANVPVTLLSTPAGTAYIVNNAGGDVKGIVTVQRYITPSNPGAGYRHYSSPVSKASFDPTSNTVADLGTATYTPVVNAAYNSASLPRQVRPYPTVFFYNQQRLATTNASYAVGDFDNGFLSPAALTDTLSPGRGYVVNLPGTELVEFRGKPRSGNYSSGFLQRGAQTTAGYHLLGNPYPGAISYTTVYGASFGIQDGLYVYRSNGPYTGSYSTYLSNGQSVNGGTDNIPLAQGFFVRAQVGGGQVSFTNAARTNAPETAPFQRPAGTAPALALTLSGPGVANQTRIYFDANATAGFDNGLDAAYLAPTHGLDLASDLAPEPFAINGLPLPTGTTTVPLRLHAATTGTYTLTVDELANLPAGYHAYLRDGRTSTYTDLATTPTFSLTLAPADAATGRFAVVFGTSAVLAAAPAAQAALVALYPNPAPGRTTLLLPQGLRGAAASQVAVLNALGQVVRHLAAALGTPEAVELPLTGLAPGIYTVRVQAGAVVVSKRLIIE